MAWTVWAAMTLLFRRRRFCWRGTRKTLAIPFISSSASPLSMANMEGKEVRFGIFNSALFATITTDASCGAVKRDARFVHRPRRFSAAV